jgi:hypothetical protein
MLRNAKIISDSPDLRTMFLDILSENYKNGTLRLNLCEVGVLTKENEEYSFTIKYLDND